MKKNIWPVTKDDERQARPDGTCFYCSVPIGGIHKSDCVIRERTVVIDVRIRMVKKFPESWDQHSIEFSMNESSSCFNNILEEINDLSERCGCLCAFAEGSYIGEAGPGDEHFCKTYIDPAILVEENKNVAQQMLTASAVGLRALPNAEHFG